MGMIYLKDETVVKLKAMATKERRTLTVLVEILMEDQEKYKKEVKK